MRRAVIFRTADRPAYAERSLRHLLEHTEPDTMICVIENSSMTATQQQTHHAVDRAWRNHFPPAEGREFRVWGGSGRLGGPGAINMGCRKIHELFPEVEQVCVVDDDLLVPLPVHQDGTMIWWDKALGRMLDAGWVVAGHPWAPNFHAGEQVDHGGALGYSYRHIGGGCSAFAMSTWEGRKINEISLIRGYVEWMRKVAQDGWCGYSASPAMVTVHFDRTEHPWSMRDTTYCAWSDEMWKDRFAQDRERRGQPRPLGLAGCW